MGLMNLFGGADIYGDLITPEQRSALQQQAMLNTGLAILMGSTGQAGGAMPNLGQAVGGGIAAGQKGYQQGVQTLIEGQLTKAKLDEARRKVAMQNRIASILGGEAPSGAPGGMPSAAGSPGGLPPAAGASSGGGMSAGGGMPANDVSARAARYREVANSIAAYDPDTAKNYLEIADRLDPIPEWSQPFEVFDPASNQNVLVVQDKRGNRRLVDGFQPKLDVPTEINAVEYFQPGGRGSLKGSGQAGMDMVGNYNRTKATNVTQVNNPEGKGVTKVFETLGANLPALEAQAQSAVRTNQALSDLIELNKRDTFTGLLAPGAVGATQFLNSFGIDAGDKLSNTREFQAASNILVLDFMGAMGGARGFSKEESQILYDAFPKIIDDPKARARIAQMLMRRNNRLIDEYNAARQQFEAGVGVTLPLRDFRPTDPGASQGFSIRRKQ